MITIKTAIRLEGKAEDIKAAAEAAGLKWHGDRNGLTARIYLAADLTPTEAIEALIKAENGKSRT